MRLTQFPGGRTQAVGLNGPRPARPSPPCPRIGALGPQRSPFERGAGAGARVLFEFPAAAERGRCDRPTILQRSLKSHIFNKTILPKPICAILTSNQIEMKTLCDVMIDFVFGLMRRFGGRKLSDVWATLKRRAFRSEFGVEARDWSGASRENYNKKSDQWGAAGWFKAARTTANRTIQNVG